VGLRRWACAVDGFRNPQGQPTFGCIKPVVNNGRSTTNLKIMEFQLHVPQLVSLQEFTEPSIVSPTKETKAYTRVKVDGTVTMYWFI